MESPTGRLFHGNQRASLVIFSANSGFGTGIAVLISFMSHEITFHFRNKLSALLLLIHIFEILQYLMDRRT